VVGSRRSLHGEHEYDVGVASGKVTTVETQREGGGPQRGGNVSNSHRGGSDDPCGTRAERGG
jgi:hypothetical protein